MKLHPVLFHTDDIKDGVPRHVLFSVFPKFELYICTSNYTKAITLDYVTTLHIHNINNRIGSYKENGWDLVKNHNLDEIYNLYGLTRNL